MELIIQFCILFIKKIRLPFVAKVSFSEKKPLEDAGNVSPHVFGGK